MSDSFSQYGEDQVLARLFSGYATGNLIDVGAYQPEALSNSRLLINAGWNATLVEFSPGPVRDLVKEYGSNDRVRVIAAAVTPGPRFIERFTVTDDAISTDDPNATERWTNMRAGYHGGFYGNLWVPTIHVHGLLEQFYGPDKAVDFVNVDTEGSSVDVALAFMAEDGPWKPRVLCVEYDDRLAYLMIEAQKLGYGQADINGCNVILERR
jgi:hypothetical protein